MTDARTDAREIPQIYLCTPAGSLQQGTEMLARALDAVAIGCVRLRADGDADAISRAADQYRAITDARDVPLVIDSHIGIAQRLGLDGVHLLDGARSVAAARKELGDDAIIGAFCGASQHDGMTAGERGADYASFGPVSPTGLGDGTVAPLDLFQWWSQMIELPIVAEGGMADGAIVALSAHADFLTFGDGVWTAEDPVAELKRRYDLML